MAGARCTAVSPAPRIPSAWQPSEASANGDIEATLWAAADQFRNNLDAAEYKHVILGLNQAVRRNAARFPEDFMFRLTAEEVATRS